MIRKGKDIFGEVVNVASRMQSKAPPGDILLTDATYQEIKEYVRCTQLGDIEVKGIKDFITAYSPQEVIADTTKLMDGGKDEPGLQRLKESIFVPSFQIPSGKADAGPLPALIKEIFSEISRAIEELASDYHDEYEFKKYLQEKWNAGDGPAFGWAARMAPPLGGMCGRRPRHLTPPRYPTAFDAAAVFHGI